MTWQWSRPATTIPQNHTKPTATEIAVTTEESLNELGKTVLKYRLFAADQSGEVALEWRQQKGPPLLARWLRSWARGRSSVGRALASQAMPGT